jgi:Ser/Thr protein kinase RdoA (MazF antagonist)
MTDALIQTAHDALDAWGDGTLTLIGQRENTVFRADMTDGSTLALRLHRIGYQSPAHIEGELTWTAALAGADFPCPRPVPTNTGAMIQHLPNDQMATAVTWIDATPIGQHGKGFTGTPDAHAALYHRIGKLIRRLHTLTDALQLDVKRAAWDLDGLTGAAPLWGKFWENPALSISERALIDDTLAQARHHLENLNNPDTGLIHADIMQENLLQNGTDLHLIDFDDSGFGFRLFDLGTALIQHHECPYKADLKSALCEGYGASEDDIDLFIMLRAMSSAGWIIPRAEMNDPKQRHYAERMLTCIATYTQG